MKWVIFMLDRQYITLHIMYNSFMYPFFWYKSSFSAIFLHTSYICIIGLLKNSDLFSKYDLLWHQMWTLNFNIFKSPQCITTNVLTKIFYNIPSRSTVCIKMMEKEKRMHYFSKTKKQIAIIFISQESAYWGLSSGIHFVENDTFNAEKSRKEIGR